MRQDRNIHAGCVIEKWLLEKQVYDPFDRFSKPAPVQKGHNDASKKKKKKKAVVFEN